MKCLKIKEEFDLEDLKKYGFKIHNTDYYGHDGLWYYELDKTDHTHYLFRVFECDREVMVYNELPRKDYGNIELCSEALVLLFQMIQDNIVEIGENNEE